MAIFTLCTINGFNLLAYQPDLLLLELISCNVDHFLTELVFDILNGPECLHSLGDSQYLCDPGFAEQIQLARRTY